MPRNGKSPEPRWNEVFDTRLGSPRTPYSEVIGQLEQATSSDLRELEERLEAALRELGITFELPTGEHHNTWFCDLLPQIFANEEWGQIVRGFQQRFRRRDASVHNHHRQWARRLQPVPVLGLGDIGQPRDHLSTTAAVMCSL